jgi:two-component system, OmpR family, response regulator
MTKINPPHILIVEDENVTAYLLKEHLKLAGFIAKICSDGEDGWNTVQKERFDIMILDVNMPKIDGFELAKLIRVKNKITPIIFLTANSTQEDKIKGFQIGGDEYITKPYSVEELIARIHVILRRMQPVQSIASTSVEELLHVGKSEVDITNHTYKIGDIEKKFSTTEGQMLKLFIENKNKLLTRNTILLHIWGRDDYYTARNMDVYINKLRKMTKDDLLIEIVNVHGSGFKLVEK